MGAAAVVSLEEARRARPHAEARQRIKTFLGTCEHAVMTQVWVALMTDLILACLRFKAGLGLSFRQIVHFLQINLFESSCAGPHRLMLAELSYYGLYNLTGQPLRASRD